MQLVDSDRENQQTPTFYSNPSAGAAIAVAAGGQVDAEFDFANDSPDVAVFCLECEGLPDARWTAGTGHQYEVAAAAAGGGTLRLTFQPTIDAVPGEYPFKVRVLCGNVVIGSPVSLMLRIGAPVRREIPAVPAQPAWTAPPAAPQPPPQSVPLEPPPSPPPTRGQAERTLVMEPLQPDQTPRRMPAQPTWTPPPAPVQNVPPAQPAWTPPAAAAPPPTPSWTAPPAPIQPPPPAQPAWTPPPAPIAPRVQEEPLHIVDLTPPAVEADSDEDAGPTPIVEPSVVSPRNGAVFTVRPGESLLVRFPFTNTTPEVKTYVLDEDRSLTSGWITLVQDQVNITRNGEGELSFRLTPPLTADAGDYPFTVNVGPQGGTISSFSLVLQVPVVPALRLTAKKPKVTIGPLSRTADLMFAAEISGNADTAFRVAAKSREAGQEERDIYETPGWRYIFDKELETLETPTQNRPSAPVPLRLRVQRRGTWWFGFRESHTVHVVAVPVTESNNGGKPGNTLDLTVSRWRLLPIPLALFVPLLLFLIILGSGGAHTLEATNAIADEDGHYWAVQPPGEQKEVTLNWTADRFAYLRLIGKTGDKITNSVQRFGSGSYTDQVDVSNENRKVDRTYNVGRVMGGGDQEIGVSYIYTRADTPLQVIDATTGREIIGGETTLNVPVTGYARLTLRNGSTQFTRIDWWIGDRLDPDDPYQFLYVKNSGSLQPGGTENFLISRNPSVPLQDGIIMFITTDATRPVMTVHLTTK